MDGAHQALNGNAAFVEGVLLQQRNALLQLREETAPREQFKRANALLERGSWWRDKLILDVGGGVDKRNLIDRDRFARFEQHEIRRDERGQMDATLSSLLFDRRCQQPHSINDCLHSPHDFAVPREMPPAY
jgi:hypothetical protein